MLCATRITQEWEAGAKTEQEGTREVRIDFLCWEPDYQEITPRHLDSVIQKKSFLSEDLVAPIIQMEQDCK